MYANKGNVQIGLTTEAEKRQYLAAGYDIIDDDGVVIEYSDKKMISYKQHLILVEEAVANAVESAGLVDVKNLNDTIAKLTQENEALTKQLNEFEEDTM